jgi:hypothetical protein
MARKPRKSKTDKALSTAKAGMVATEIVGHPLTHGIDAAKSSVGAVQHGSKAASALGYAGKAVSTLAGITAKAALPLTAAYAGYKAVQKAAAGGSSGEVTMAAVDAATFGFGTYATSGTGTGSAASGRLASRNRSKGNGMMTPENIVAASGPQKKTANRVAKSTSPDQSPTFRARKAAAENVQAHRQAKAKAPEKSDGVVNAHAKRVNGKTVRVDQRRMTPAEMKRS